MVDKEKEVINEFGYTNQDGGIESVRYDEEGSLVVIDVGDGIGILVYPEDVHNLIKALQHMQKYLVDKGVIKE
jgi:ribosomal protein S15P/S13E